jgi:hypothetical protein
LSWFSHKKGKDENRELLNFRDPQINEVDGPKEAKHAFAPPFSLQKWQFAA